MHRRNPSTPIRRTPFKSRHDFSGNENSSAFLPSHYHTPTRPSNYRTSSGQGPASPMIACSNHTLNSISYNGRNRLKFKPYLLMGVAFVGLLVFGRAFVNITAASKLKRELAEAQELHAKNSRALNAAKSTSINLEQRAAISERENMQMKDRLDLQIKQKESELKKKAQMKKREDAITKQVRYLEKQVQEVSRREAIERFGSGPHFVEFSVIFADMEDHELPSKFKVEMAPLDLMPHSVLLFLEMVEKRLWDETAFVHHADHIISATPTVYHSGESKREEFEKAGLSHVAFQEYTEEYSHDPYTLGFSGRPGGPDFYVSTMNNREMHGPGGQLDADLVEEADPCFAKVVEGFDVVDKIYQKDSEAPLDIHVVGIITARIVEK